MADPLQQLRSLNKILAGLSRGGLERAAHAEVALRYFAAQEGGKTDEQAAGSARASTLDRAAAALVRLHLELEPELAGRIAFAHWNAAEHAGEGELWMRVALIRELKTLAGCEAALLLVTGLREFVCPGRSRWTQARRASYARFRHWIEELACRYATPTTRLQLIVL